MGHPAASDQVIITAEADGPSPPNEFTGDMVKELLGAYGKFYQFSVVSQGDSSMTFSVNFVDPKNAETVLEHLEVQPHIAKDVKLRVGESEALSSIESQSKPSIYSDGLLLTPPLDSPADRPTWMNNDFSGRFVPMPNHAAASGFQSFEGILAIPRMPNGGAVQTPTSQFRNDWSDGSRRSNRAHPSQVIDADRIQAGHDLRTTIMLRNIPNRIRVSELKAILDETNAGRFDFLYLRFDFKHGTNVGYGFVNFISAEEVIKFSSKYVNHPWPGHPGRICQISYAAIQGLDRLVEKFRNSAIMMHQYDFRPQLFWSIRDAATNADVGKPRDFPDCNNRAKLQRSCDNAQSIGLYSHQNEHHPRNQGRGSRYDRGTPAQLREERLSGPPAFASINGQSNYTFAHGEQNGFSPPQLIDTPTMNGIGNYSPSFQNGSDFNLLHQSNSPNVGFFPMHMQPASHLYHQGGFLPMAGHGLGMPHYHDTAQPYQQFRNPMQAAMYTNKPYVPMPTAPATSEQYKQPMLAVNGVNGHHVPLTKHTPGARQEPTSTSGQTNKPFPSAKSSSGPSDQRAI